MSESQNQEPQAVSSIKQGQLIKENIGVASKNQQNTVHMTLCHESSENQQFAICFKPEIEKFDVKLIAGGNFSQSYHIPAQITTFHGALQAMEDFLQIHEYCPSGIKIKKPFLHEKIPQFLDTKSSNFVERFTKEQNLLEGQQILTLAHFVRFDFLFQSMACALLSIFFSKMKAEEEAEAVREKNETTSKLKKEKEDQLFQILQEYEKFICESQELEKQEIYCKQLYKFMPASAEVMGENYQKQP